MLTRRPREVLRTCVTLRLSSPTISRDCHRFIGSLERGSTHPKCLKTDCLSTREVPRISSLWSHNWMGNSQMGASPYMEARITAMHAFRTPVSPTLAIADISHQRKKIGQFLNSRAVEDLSNRNTGRSLLDLNPPLGKRKHLARGLSRRDTSRYNQFLSGHFPCRQYLARFKLNDGDEMCDCSEAIESREHILESSSLFDEERAQLIREATKCGIPPDRLWEAAYLIAEFLQNITKKWTNRRVLWRTLK